MSVTYLIEFQVKPERCEDFLALLHGVLDAMRVEAGFVSSTLHADPQEPHRFLLIETWRDHDEVVKVELRRSYRDAWHSALPELLAAPRAISVWTPIRRD